VRGFVLNENGTPLRDVTLVDLVSGNEDKTKEDGSFEILTFLENGSEVVEIRFI